MTTAEGLRSHLRIGQKITVIDSAGQTVKGRFDVMDPDGTLVIALPSRRHFRVPAGALDVIERNDGSFDGMLKGVAVGLVLALWTSRYVSGPQGPLLIGGAGIGFTIDKLMKKRELTVRYRSAPVPTTAALGF